MSTEENKSIVGHLFEEMVNKGNLSISTQIISSAYVDRVERLVMFIRTAFPDFHATIEDLVAEDDKVTVMFIAHGTHLGETTFAAEGEIPMFVSPELPLKKQEVWPNGIRSIPINEIEKKFTIPSTDKQLTYVGTKVFRVVDKKITDCWGGWLSDVEPFLRWAHH